MISDGQRGEDNQRAIPAATDLNRYLCWATLRRYAVAEPMNPVGRPHQSLDFANLNESSSTRRRQLQRGEAHQDAGDA